MSRRSLAWIATALVALLSIAGMLWSSFGSGKVVFTAPELQTRLNQQLPRTVRNVTISGLALSVADNRVTLRIDIQTAVLHQPVSAVVSAIGVPRYDARGEAMYFDVDDVRISQLTVSGKAVVDDTTNAYGKLAEAVGPAVQRLAEAAAKAYLAALPVYRFKNDFKGFVLKAALSEVKIEQNSLVVVFSLWNLTVVTLILALPLAAVALFVVLLILDPLWGLRTMTDVATVNHVTEIPLAVGVNMIGKLVSMDWKAKPRQEQPPPRKVPPPSP
jgi:hypothetical protein